MSRCDGRLHVDLRPELAARVEKQIPRGLKSIVVRSLLEALVVEMEKNGKGILGPVLSKELNIRELVGSNFER